MKTLIDKAHAKGMKVFFDIITNHTADVINYDPRDLHLHRQGHRAVQGRERERSSTTRTYAGKDTFPDAGPGDVVPAQAGVPDRGRQDRQGAGLAERPDALPQPRRLDLRRRELRLRRLLRPGRPVHREPPGRLRHGGHLQGLGRPRHRRLPDRHRQAREPGVLAAVLPGRAGARPRAGQRRLLHVRRGLRRQPGLPEHLHHGRQAARHPGLRLPERGAAVRRRQERHRCCGTCSPATTTTPTPTPTPTSCRPSSATTTWAGSPRSWGRPTTS